MFPFLLLLLLVFYDFCIFLKSHVFIESTMVHIRPRTPSLKPQRIHYWSRFCTSGQPAAPWGRICWSTRAACDCVVLGALIAEFCHGFRVSVQRLANQGLYQHHFCMLNSTLSVNTDKTPLLSALCKWCRVLQALHRREKKPQRFICGGTRETKTIWNSSHLLSSEAWPWPSPVIKQMMDNLVTPHPVSYHSSIFSLRRLSFLQYPLSLRPSLLLRPSPLPVHLRSCL